MGAAVVSAYALDREVTLIEWPMLSEASTLLPFTHGVGK